MSKIEKASEKKGATPLIEKDIYDTFVEDIFIK
jgi:hypothetical protein